jgi:hypothetical protein
MRRAAAVLAAASVLGCGGGGAGDWDAAVIRAVARRAEAGSGERTLLILDRSGSPSGPELPFGIRQALTTAGFELDDGRSLDAPASRLLTLVDVARTGDEWLVGVTVHDTPDPDRSDPIPLVWRVQCMDGRCEAVDSMPRPPT